MKKLISGMIFASFVVPAFAAPVQYSSGNGWFDGTWYGGIRGELSFLNWKNEYSASDVKIDGQSESFSFQPVFGGGLSFGHIFNENWRGEIEAGIIGRYSDSSIDDGYVIDFSLTIPYLSVNAIYDFIEPELAGLYFGAGFGVALPKVVFDSNNMDIEERAVSPMFSFMVGYSYEMSDSVTLDLRYRLSAMTGVSGKESNVNGLADAYFEIDTGLILDNSISLGLRYEF